MAETYDVSIRFKDNNSGARKLNAKYTVTPTDDQYAGGRETVQDSEVSFDHSAKITDAGLLWMINKGTTDAIQVGFAASNYDFKLEPGHAALIPLDTQAATIYCLAAGTADTDNFEYEFRQR